MRSREDMISIIQKMKAKADDPICTPEEKEAFNLQITQLMEKYKLESADLDDADIQDFEFFFKEPTPLHWPKDLGGSIALAFNCEPIVIYEGHKEDGIHSGLKIFGQKILLLDLVKIAIEHYYKVVASEVEALFNQPNYRYIDKNRKSFITESFGKGLARAVTDNLSIDLMNRQREEPRSSEILPIEGSIEAPLEKTGNELVPVNEDSEEETSNQELQEYTQKILEDIQEEEEVTLKVDPYFYNRGLNQYNPDTLLVEINDKFVEQTKNRKQRRREKAQARKKG